MVKYSCEHCGKGFFQKSYYLSHKKQKTPCKDNVGKIKILINKKVGDKTNNLVPNKPLSPEYNLFKILNSVLENKSYKEIAEILNVSVGTIKRWNELEKVPKAYCFELMRMDNISIDYSQFTYKEKDQFFTPKQTTNYCFSKFLEIIQKYGDTE